MDAVILPKVNCFAEQIAIVLSLHQYLQDGNHCISASRDRSICLWDTTGSVTHPVVHKVDSHTGWIWDLEIHDENQFLSCSWDSSVKLWNMDNFSQHSEPVQKFT